MAVLMFSRPPRNRSHRSTDGNSLEPAIGDTLPPSNARHCGARGKCRYLGIRSSPACSGGASHLSADPGQYRLHTRFSVPSQSTSLWSRRGENADGRCTFRVDARPPLLTGIRVRASRVV